MEDVSSDIRSEFGITNVNGWMDRDERIDPPCLVQVVKFGGSGVIAHYLNYTAYLNTVVGHHFITTVYTSSDGCL